VKFQCFVCLALVIEHLAEISFFHSSKMFVAKGEFIILICGGKWRFWDEGKKFGD
jgi:hypothetical protein